MPPEQSPCIYLVYTHTYVVSTLSREYAERRLGVPARIGKGLHTRRFPRCGCINWRTYLFAEGPPPEVESAVVVVLVVLLIVNSSQNSYPSRKRQEQSLHTPKKRKD